jgi:hypothetical protein
MRRIIARWSSANSWVAAMPRAEFASSTAPIAAIRGASLPVREPSTRPVSPASPVRV